MSTLTYDMVGLYCTVCLELFAIHIYSLPASPVSNRVCDTRWRKRHYPKTINNNRRQQTTTTDDNSIDCATADDDDDNATATVYRHYLNSTRTIPPNAPVGQPSRPHCNQPSPPARLKHKHTHSCGNSICAGTTRKLLVAVCRRVAHRLITYTYLHQRVHICTSERWPPPMPSLAKRCTRTLLMQKLLAGSIRFC